MTPEQMENAMNFIVEQQAKFSVDMDLLKDSQAATDQRIKEILAVQSTHQELIERLTEASVKTFDALAELIKAQRLTDKMMKEASAETNDRLNILINVVENHISNHPGGKEI